MKQIPQTASRAWMVYSALSASIFMASCTMMAPASATAQQQARDEMYQGDHMAARIAISLADPERAIELLEPLRENLDCPAAILVSLAEAYQNARRPDDSRAAIDEAIERYPRDVDALEFRAGQNVRAGRLDEAVVDLEAALEVMPENTDILEQAGLLLLQTTRDWSYREGDEDSGAARLMRIYEKLAEIRQGAQGVQPLVILSTVYARTGQHDKAIARARMAVELRPQDVRGHMALGDALQVAGESAEALDAYRQALLIEPGQQSIQRQIERLITTHGYEGGVLGFYRELAEDRPGYKSIQDVYAAELLKREQWGEAEAQYSRIVERWPTDRQARSALVFAKAMAGAEGDAGAMIDRMLADEATTPEEVLELSGLLIAAGRNAMALELLEKAAETHGNDPRVPLLLATVQTQRGEEDAAIATLEALYADRPDQEAAAAMLTRLYLLKYSPERAQENWAEAIALIERLIELNETNDLFLVEAGALTIAAGQPDRAEPFLRKAIEIAPDNADAYSTLGNLYYETDRIELAEEILREAIERFPTRADIYNNLGYFMTEANRDVAEALKLIERADEITPGQDYILDSLGWAHFKLGSHGKAIEYLTRAIGASAAPDPVMYDHLGDAYAASGDREQAIEQWNRAIELDPESGEVDVAEIRKKIEGR